MRTAHSQRQAAGQGPNLLGAPTARPRRPLPRARRAQLPVLAAAATAVAPSQTTAWPPLVLQSTVDELPSPQQPELGFRTDFNTAYVKGKLLGSGSFGTVHLGFNIQTGTQVAIKTLPKQVRGKLTREKTLEKIWKETDMLSRLQPCPGVVRLLDAFEDSSNVQLVMELAAGGDLQQYVEAKGSLNESELAVVAFEVLRIISCCHGLGVLHGDIKPANLMIRGDKLKPSPSNLCVIDYGCSQFLGPRRLSRRTGTPIFMAPEVFRRDYSEAADTWAMGVTLYWLFSKKFPFFESNDVVKQAKLDAVEEAVTYMPISYTGGPWEQLSADGLNFIQSCLERDEDERATCEDLLHHPWLEQHISKADIRQAAALVSTAA